MEISHFSLDVLKQKTAAQRKALGVVRVRGQTRKQLDEAIPGLGGRMCTGGNHSCLKALFPNHKHKRNGNPRKQCDPCGGMPRSKSTPSMRDLHNSSIVSSHEETIEKIEDAEKAKMLMVEHVMGWLDLVPRTKGIFERAWEGLNHTFFGSPLLPTTLRPTSATPEPHGMPALNA